MTSQNIHNGHRNQREVWAVYYLPDSSEPTSLAILWTMPVPVDDSVPCATCRKIGTEGPCPGVKAHAYAQHARLSLRITLSPLEVEMFTLPPHVSPDMCAGNLYAQIMKRSKENWPPEPEGTDGQR